MKVYSKQDETHILQNFMGFEHRKIIHFIHIENSYRGGELSFSFGGTFLFL